jgi:hypothetical protein
VISDRQKNPAGKKARKRKLCAPLVLDERKIVVAFRGVCA